MSVSNQWNLAPSWHERMLPLPKDTTSTIMPSTSQSSKLTKVTSDTGRQDSKTSTRVIRQTLHEPKVTVTRPKSTSTNSPSHYSVGRQSSQASADSYILTNIERRLETLADAQGCINQHTSNELAELKRFVQTIIGSLMTVLENKALVNVASRKAPEASLYDDAKPTLGMEIGNRSKLRSAQVSCTTGLRAIGHDDPVVPPSTDFTSQRRNAASLQPPCDGTQREISDSWQETGSGESVQSTQEGRFMQKHRKSVKMWLPETAINEPESVQDSECASSNKCAVASERRAATSATSRGSNKATAANLSKNKGTPMFGWNSTATNKTSVSDLPAARAPLASTASQLLSVPRSSWLAAYTPSTKTLITNSNGSHARTSGFGTRNPPRYVLYPDSPKKHFWDSCGSVIMLYESLIIPVSLAWQSQENIYMTLSMWCTTVFWTLDIALRFNTGFYGTNDIVVRRSAIAMQYIKRFFIFDAMATGVDWITAIFFERSNVRIYLRLLRFLRLNSLWNRLEQLQNLFLSDLWHKSMQIFTMLFGILIVNHFVCCCWFFIGDRGYQDTHGSWLESSEEFDGTKVPYSELPKFYQYVTSYHWSVVQMFVGSTQINARNGIERTFNIGCNLFGTFFTAVITSWLSALWIQHHQSKIELEQEMKKVRQYLVEFSLPPHISTPILKQLNIRLCAKEYSTEADIRGFEMLSKSLKSQMRYEIFSPALLRSPTMFLLKNIDNSIILNLCYSLEYICLLGGDDFFQPGNPLQSAYFTVRGTMGYALAAVSSEPVDPDVLHENPSADELGDAVCCNEGSWIAEAAMWTADWTARGQMQCGTSFAEIVGVSPDEVKQSLRYSKDSKPDILIKAYAEAYQNLLIGVTPERLSDIIAPVEHAMVLMTMTIRARFAACHPVLQQIRQRERGVLNFTFQKAPKGATELEAEIRNGECCLSYNSEGLPVRIAFVVLLRAERSDGMILIQVAKIVDGTATPKLQMPATKVKDNELPAQAANRILQKNLSDFGSGQELERCTYETEIRDTTNYGMKTRFYRSVYHVSFKEISSTAITVEVADPSPCDGQNVNYGRGMSNVSSWSKKLDASHQKGYLGPSRHRGSKSGQFAPSLPLPKKVFFVRSGSRANGTIYSWMSPTTHEALEQNASALNEWVSRIDVSDCADDAYVCPTVSN